MSRLLRDRYYIGEITYKDETYDGRHPALVDRELFDRVQSMLEDTGKAGERKRVYDSYLKGSVFCCGECQLERGRGDNRLLIQRAVGRNEAECFYFFCSARQRTMRLPPHPDARR